MKRQGSGFGFVVLIVVVVVVLLLATKAWKAVMPTATQAVHHGDAGAAVSDHGQKEAGQAVRSGSLPDLKKMGQNTDTHVQQVNEAAKGQD